MIKLKTIFVEKEERCLASGFLFSRGWLDIFVFLYYVDIHIHYNANDWFVFKGVKVLKDGKRINVFEKNEKYKNSKTYIFPLPKGKI